MSTLQQVLNSCPWRVPPCHIRKAEQLHQQLTCGIPYTRLGGKRIRQNRNLVRFKIGRDWRLLYRRKSCGAMEPYLLIIRQQFEQTLMRRCSQH